MDDITEDSMTRKITLHFIGMKRCGVCPDCVREQESEKGSGFGANSPAFQAGWELAFGGPKKDVPLS